MEQLGISKLDLKRQNRMQILKVLKQKGPVSRIDIASYLELTRAAVTIITNDMIEQGVIEEIGELKHINEKAPRGRKKILININGNNKFVIGVTVESDRVNIGLCNLFGDVLDKSCYYTDDKISVDSLIKYIKTSFYEILEKNCLKEDKILGIGLGIMPELYSQLNITVNDDRTDYSAVLSGISEFTDVSVAVDNCVKGFAMANIDFQKNRNPDRKNIGFLKFGDVYNFVFANLNSPIVSYDNRTSFVNKIIVNLNSNCKDSDNIAGSVSAEISRKSIFNKINKVFGKETTPELFRMLNGSISELTMEKFFSAVKKGDGKLEEINDEIFRYLAVLINNLIYITDPERLVLHDFSISNSEFDKLRKTVENLSGKDVADKLDISMLDERNRFLGGAAVAIRELFYTKGGF